MSHLANSLQFLLKRFVPLLSQKIALGFIRHHSQL